MSNSLWLHGPEALLSMDFTRQEYWSGLPFPTPGGSSQPRDQTHVSRISCICRQVLYWLSYQGSPIIWITCQHFKQIFHKNFNFQLLLKNQNCQQHLARISMWHKLWWISSCFLRWSTCSPVYQSLILAWFSSLLLA